MQIDLIVVDDMSGSAHALRAVSDRIRGDFFVLSADFISSRPLGEMATLHRLNSADCTIMFTCAAADAKRDEVDQEYVAISNDGRVNMKIPLLEIEEEIEIPKALLHKVASFNLRDDLIDLGVYVFSHWVMEHLMENKNLTNVRTELVPYLVARQFQPAAQLLKTMPALRHRARPLCSIEPWLLVHEDSSINTKSALPIAWGIESRTSLAEMSSILHNDGFDALTHTNTITSASMNISRGVSDGLVGANGTSSVVGGENTSSSGSGSGIIPASRGKSDESSVTIGGADVIPNVEDMLRVYSIVYEERTDSPQSLLLSRITNIQSYLALNKDVPMHNHTKATPWPRLPGYLKKELSIVGEGCNYAEDGKMVTIKQCSIGANCIIGNKTKLNNCVVMDNVTIGDCCVIQNCVLSDGVVIESNCNLNECNMGAGYVMPAGTKAKVDSFSTKF